MTSADLLSGDNKSKVREEKINMLCGGPCVIKRNRVIIIRAFSGGRGTHFFRSLSGEADCQR